MSKLAVLVWCLALAAVVAVPWWTGSPTVGDDLTRNTVRLALAWYAAALVLMLLLQPAEWTASTWRGRLARCCWTLAWAAYLVHLAAAFHFEHHWSHAHAVEHTAQSSGFGEGIYFSHLFTLLWTADVAWWWLRPGSYAGRSRWVDRLLHGYLLFIVFNATVVFASGPIRWVGLGAFVVLALLWCLRARRHSFSRQAAGAYNLQGSQSSQAPLQVLPRGGSPPHG